MSGKSYDSSRGEYPRRLYGSGRSGDVIDAEMGEVYRRLNCLYTEYWYGTKPGKVSSDQKI